MNAWRSSCATGIWALGVACAFDVLGALAGCRQVVGITDRSATDADTSVAGKVGGFHYPTAACAACMDTSCEVELTACRDSPTCAPYFDCLLPCAADDDACRARCHLVSNWAQPKHDIAGCRARSCGDACGVARCGGDVWLPNEVCEICLRANCCKEEHDYAVDEEAAAYRQCGTCDAVGTEPCPCKEQHDAGAAAYNAYSTCHNNHCGTECVWGRDWGCLAHPDAWPVAAKNAPITIRVRLLDESNHAYPDPFLTVKACGRLDYECSAVPSIARGTTDKDGWVELTIPYGAFDSYLDISGSTAYPELIYFGSPPQEDIDVGVVSAPTVAGMKKLVDAARPGLSVLSDHGSLLVQSYDCDFLAATGVSIESGSSDSNSVRWYLRGGLAPDPAATATDGSGVGGYVNLPTGLTNVTISVAGRAYGEARVYIRPGAFTRVYIGPSPP